MSIPPFYRLDLYVEHVKESRSFFFSSRRRHTRWPRDWSSDVCSSDLLNVGDTVRLTPEGLPTIDGVIDYVQPGEDFLAVRADDGLYRFHSLERMGRPLAFGHYLYATSEEIGRASCRERERDSGGARTA